MAKNLMTITMIVALSSGLAFVGGCESDAQTGALLGTGIGAGVGALAGGDTEGTLIGAAVGGELFRCLSKGRVSAMSAQEASITMSFRPKTS